MQQGDLLFFRVGDAGVETDQTEDTSKVILEGETTGHYHAVASDTARLFKFPVDEQGAFAIIDVHDRTPVVHDGPDGGDHLPVELREGTWVVKQVQTVDTVSVLAEIKRQEVVLMEKRERERREAIERRNQRAVFD